jgi:chromosome segregation protein
MQLSRLEIKGFKSFGDKITINFNEGVTAIVGPNGCGKSNVVDAIRWVLGEQSTRALRSEKMENVIFNGTRNRKSSNLAEVSLTFDNTKNILPTDFSQVTITRKLYRTGESEYRLNDVQCRLKDITDLFLDTGIGSDSYSIIELKMIDEIISNKEGSRRNLFEEASGISKYKLRKKQTFNKLKETEADLERVEDLLFEIQKNLKTLENQANKAERYHWLKDKYKSLSITLASLRIAGFKNSLESIEHQQQNQLLEKTKFTTLIDQLEAALQQLKLESLRDEKNLSVQQKATNEHVLKIRTYENEKKLKNEQLKYHQDREKKTTDELEKDRNQFNHVLYNIKRLNEEKAEEEEKLAKLLENLALLKEVAEELKLDQQDSKQELDILIQQNNQLQNQTYKTEKDIDILIIQLEALEHERNRNTEDATHKESELTEFNRVLAELEIRQETLMQENALTRQFEEDLKIEIQETEQQLAALKDEVIQESRKMDAKQNEYNLTKSLIDNLEGFPESIRFLKKNANWTKPVPLLSDILFCKEEYRIAIENFLEPVMNHYVVDEMPEALKAIELLSSSSKGRAQFFINDIRNFPQKDLIPFNVGIPAMDVVEIDEKYKALCTCLLGNVYILHDDNQPDLPNINIPSAITILTRSGKFSKTRISMAGGSVGLFEGKRIGRAKNLENLAKEIKQAELKINSQKVQIEQMQHRIAALKDAGKAEVIKKQQLDLNRLQTELITVKTKQEQYESFLKNHQSRKDAIAIKINSINEELFKLRPQLAELKTRQQIEKDLLISKQQAFNEVSEMVTVQSSRYNQENIRFHQQQNKVSGLIKDLEYRSSQHDALELRIEQHNNDLEKIKAAILETLVHTDHSDDDLMAMYEQKEALEKATQQAEQEYYSSKGIINDKENEISLLRKKKEHAELLENELKDQKNDLRLKLNALKERLSVEFNINIHDLLEEQVQEDESEEELLEKTEKLKKQLNDFGSINPMALEAYQEMKERFEFIQLQKKDLHEAKTSLMETIKEIDDTAKEKFLFSFTQVRENFIRVFRSLFNEEDSCDLVLTTPDKPLESDIDIIAKPKGKRPLSINQLSGGEKTLTATAILFSLYLLKPAPFCIFDEVDAPLDDTNIDKFNNIIRKFSQDSQFIIVSHNKKTIACTDIIYGVTMVEQGVSRVVAVDLREIA